MARRSNSTELHAAAFPEDHTAFVDGLIEDFAGWADEDVQEKWEVDIPTQMPSKPSLSPLGWTPKLKP